MANGYLVTILPFCLTSMRILFIHIYLSYSSLVIVNNKDVEFKNNLFLHLLWLGGSLGLGITNLSYPWKDFMEYQKLWEKLSFFEFLLNGRCPIRGLRTYYKRKTNENELQFLSKSLLKKTKRQAIKPLQTPKDKQ